MRTLSPPPSASCWRGSDERQARGLPRGMGLPGERHCWLRVGRMVPVMTGKTFKAYIVTNLVNRKKYVGVTKVTLEARWAEHLRVAANSKRARRFHRAIAKYGPDNFSMVHFASAQNRGELAELEIILIRQENTFWADGHGYNLTRGGEGPRGLIVSAETREKQRKASTGRVPSEATREKLRIASTGRTISKEGRARISLFAKTRTFSPQTRAKLSAAMNRLTKEQQQARAAKIRGRKHSPEWVAKIVAAHVGAKRSNETRAKIAAARRARERQSWLWAPECEI
jgi:group I intron endonuclease